MCDPTPVRNWILATIAAIFVVVAIIVGAAVANGSWYYSWTAPGVMISAAIVTGVAIFFNSMALGALNTFCACAGARCASACSNLRATLTAAGVLLGIQATACLLAALSAWIPSVGQAPMWIIIGALVIEAAVLITALAFLSALTSCQTTTVPPPKGSGSGAGPTL